MFDLSELVGTDKAVEFVDDVKSVKRIEGNMMEYHRSIREADVVKFRRAVVRNTTLLCELDKHLKRHRRSQ